MHGCATEANECNDPPMSIAEEKDKHRKTGKGKRGVEVRAPEEENLKCGAEPETETQTQTQDSTKEEVA